VLLFVDAGSKAPWLAAHHTEFTGPFSGSRWRHAARHEMPAVPGVVFAKAMPLIGSRSSAGFGAGTPAFRRQVFLTAWKEEDHFHRFLDHQIARRLSAQARSSWWTLFEVTATRGSHYGTTPLAATGSRDGTFAALTLGRTRVKDLPRFLREGSRLGALLSGAPGLLAAYSAGVPLTGNCTVSLWDSEQDMVRFAYRDPDGHLKAVSPDPPILIEQLNARMVLRRLGGDWSSDSVFADRLTQLGTIDA